MNRWQGMNPEKIKYLTEDELKRFFYIIDKSKKKYRKRDSCLFHLKYSFGLRASEVVQIQLDHLRMERHKIFIPRVKRRNYGGKEYPLDDEDYKRIRAWLRERKKIPVAKRGNAFLFISQMTQGLREHMGTNQLYRLFKEYAKEAGVGWAYPHALRHSCAIMLAKKGRSSFEIQDHLDHSSVLSTEVYVQMAGPERQKRAESILNDLRI